METSKLVMVSSTVRDLPGHREKVMHACMRMNMFYPEMMEHLTATNAGAVEVSLSMVDRADIYICIIGFRYGYVPKEKNRRGISVTEMEYNRAVKRGIPCLIFIMSDEHPVFPPDVEKGTGAKKLEKFKEQIINERVVSFFKSPDELLAQVIQSLVPYRESDPTKFHYTRNIPSLPEKYIAHPYTLMQTHTLIGRQVELNMLTDWVSKPRSQIGKAHVANLIAIGGMGKSALAWNWFNDIAPEEMHPLTGRMWWSFYESDATLENFVTRALSYMTQQPTEKLEKIPYFERETQLLQILNREPFLVVLDGLERILIAYARIDAAQLNDGQVENHKNLRKAADIRASRFLRKLAQTSRARILICSRLYPSDLENDLEEPLDNCFLYHISGLTDQDAVDLWRAFGITGSRDELLSIFTKIGKHPLLIQALAGEVKNFRRAPSDFTEWRKSNPNFDPNKFPRIQEAMSHVLEFSLLGLNDRVVKLINTISAFRMPARYDTIATLLVAKKRRSARRPFSTEEELDLALTELEDRGLLGWDKYANRYDLHPIVRSIVWDVMGNAAQMFEYATLHNYFDSLPQIEYNKINSLDDLTSKIELWNALFGLSRYDDAARILLDELFTIMAYKFSAGRQLAEMLEKFFPNGVDKPPLIENPELRFEITISLAIAYRNTGKPNKAIFIYKKAYQLLEFVKESKHDIDTNMSNSLLLTGKIYDAEFTARRSVFEKRNEKNYGNEGYALGCLGEALATRGMVQDAMVTLLRAQKLLQASGDNNMIFESYAQTSLGWLMFKIGNLKTALEIAKNSLNLAEYWRHEHSIIYAARLYGTIALAAKEYHVANDILEQALGRAKIAHLLEEELAVFITLAELHRQNGDFDLALQYLGDVWEPVKDGSYPLLHVDALNVLTQVEQDKENKRAAIIAARDAFRLAWCDGRPFSYFWGLIQAQQNLKKLDVAEPVMAAFDINKYSTMPELELNPNDEFHITLPDVTENQPKQRKIKKLENKLPKKGPSTRRSQKAR